MSTPAPAAAAPLSGAAFASTCAALEDELHSALVDVRVSARSGAAAAGEAAAVKLVQAALDKAAALQRALGKYMTVVQQARKAATGAAVAAAPSAESGEDEGTAAAAAATTATKKQNQKRTRRGKAKATATGDATTTADASASGGSGTEAAEEPGAAASGKQGAKKEKKVQKAAAAGVTSTATQRLIAAGLLKVGDVLHMIQPLVDAGETLQLVLADDSGRVSVTSATGTAPAPAAAAAAAADGSGEGQEKGSGDDIIGRTFASLRALSRQVRRRWLSSPAPDPYRDTRLPATGQSLEALIVTLPPLPEPAAAAKDAAE